MDFESAEKLRQSLAQDLPLLFGKTKLFRIISFYTSLLSLPEKNLIEAYSLEFIDEFFAELKLYTSFYQSPEKTESLLSHLKSLKSVSALSHFENEFDEITVSIKQQLDYLNNILEGQTNKIIVKSLRFPLIETLSNLTNTTSFGSLESINIKIHKAKNNNRFVFVPSGSKIEEKLLEQTRISLEIALNYLSMHKNKFHKHHEVLIYFENLSANYEGNSLGVALTIGFIEQLSVLYNLPYITNVINNLATTGGVNESGKIIHVGKGMIENKTEAVFFSDIDTFVIPKEDENAASLVLTKLLEKYPKKKLDIVPVADIKDIINRRDLVDIKKQSSVIRTARSIKRNWLTTLLFLILSMFLIFIYVKDYDDNPEKIETTNDGYSITNKSNRILWSIEKKLVLQIYLNSENINAIEMNIRVIDINYDKLNEVVYCFDSNSKYSNKVNSIGSVTLSNKGKVLNHFTFKKTLTSDREEMIPPFGISMYDTITISGKRCILMSANNANSYGSALFLYNLTDNLVIGDTLWNSGHFIDARITDINNDGIKDVTILSMNNGFKRAQFSNLNLNELLGQIPSTKEYMFKGYEISKLNFLYLLPNTDLGEIVNQGFPSLRHRGLIIEDEYDLIRFIALEGGYASKKHLIYSYSLEKNNFEVSISSEFSRSRDSLVNIGKLIKPFSDTKAYRESLISKIEYWNGKEFVKYNNLR